MSNHNRKRKHRGTHTASSRPNHYRNDNADYPDFHNSEQAQFPAFLSHHDAYQASLSSSNDLSGFDIEAPQERDLPQRQDPLQALYIQAYEADIIRGPNARTAAESLEVVEYVNQASKSEGDLAGSGSISTSTFKSPPVNVQVVPKIGSALIQLQFNGVSRSQSSIPEHGSFASGNGAMRVFDDDEEGIGASSLATPPIAPQSTPKNPIWVDRYDARLLLDALPTPTLHAHPSSSPISQSTPAPSSPTGWTDLSSDAEDTFFFDPEETEDFRREKRRRLLERTREERLRARREEDGDGADEETRKEEEEEVWGGSDEEPDQTQKDLMSRTATHLLSSPNPAQLEMRILANHGRDRRFAFLRGRWSKAWGLIKAKARVELAKTKQEHEHEQETTPEKKKNVNAGLGLLASYGSDSESEEEEEENEEARKAEESDKVEEKEDPGLSAKRENEVKVPDKVQVDDEEMVKEARRKRLKAWSEQRKAARGKVEDTG